MAKILIVDDDPALLILLKEFFVGLGHEVLTAPDPLTAAARAKIGKPDLMILDFQMPLGGAQAVLKNLDAVPELKKLPVLMCTGSPLDEVKKKVPETPLRRYASKPVHLSALKDKVEILLLEGLR
jgi:CheY-like chemotaxis protein